MVDDDADDLSVPGAQGPLEGESATRPSPDHPSMALVRWMRG